MCCLFKLILNTTLLCFMLGEHKGWPQWKDVYPKQPSFLCLMNITSGVIDFYCTKPIFSVSWHVLCTKAGYLETGEEDLYGKEMGSGFRIFLNES